MRKIISFLFLSILYFGAAAQAPDSLSFQAVIRDADGSLLADQSVSARVGIYQGAEDGTKVFEETHTATTNSNGLLTLLIGGGTNVTGDLATIDWGAGLYFIKREIDPNGGTDYVISGTSQFLSVPYALYAASGGSADNMGDHTATQDLNMNGNAITDTSDDTLTIEVKLNDQDIQIVSYDEIYITTINKEGMGNDPDGTPYDTYGDIELTSADDIFLKTTGGDDESDIEIISIDNILLEADDDIVIDSDDGDIEILADDNLILDADNNLYLIADDDNVEITANDKVIISSGTEDNITLSSDNDIELIANPASDDYVEIWSGSTFLYTLPNVRGEIGQILLRDRDGVDEFHSDWSPYKFPLTDGNNGQTLITDGSGNVTWGAPPAARISNNTPQTLSNYEELDSKTKALNTLLNESLSKIEELEKRLNEQQELINRQFELIKKLEENK